MSGSDESQVGRLADFLKELESGNSDEGLQESSFSKDELIQLQQARRALGRLERIASSESLLPEETKKGVSEEGENTPMEVTASAESTREDITQLAYQVSESSLPSRLGRFRITRILGRGGFGVVLLATDPKLDQQVALKIPRSELLFSEEGRERLLREARAATILSHPNIVPIFESGSIGLVPYITYGYCSGVSLDSWLNNQTSEIEPKFAARIVAQLAEAIQHAHARDILHRDLKPSNVMLASELQSERNPEEFIEKLQVGDFGLASSLSQSSELTRSGAPLGTPAYMSPEQSRGETTVTAATDIFSLGTIFYELLTGANPFRKESDLATLRAVEAEHPNAPSVRHQCIPRDLSAICMKCLEKSPDNRYGSMQALNDDLNRFLRQEPVQARSIGPIRRFKRWCARNPATTAALSFAFASLIGGLMLSVKYARNAKKSELSAIASSRTADKRTVEALALSGLYQTTYDSFRELIRNEIELDDPATRTLKDKLVDTTREHYRMVVAQRPEDGMVLREYLNMLRPMAYQLQLLGDNQSSARIWTEAADIFEQHFPEEVEEWAAVSAKLAADYIATGRLDDAVELAEEIVTKLEGVVLNDSTENLQKQLVFSLTGFASAQAARGDHLSAETTINHAQDLVSRIVDEPVEDWPADRTWARVLRTKCEIIDNLKRGSELDVIAPIGIRMYEELKEADSKNIDLALDSLPVFHHAFAWARHGEKQYEAALAHFETAQGFHDQLLERHPSQGWLYFNAANNRQWMAQVLHTSQAFDAALSQATELISSLEERIERFPQMESRFRLQLLEAHWLLALCLESLERDDQALGACTSAIALAEEIARSSQQSDSVAGRLGTLYYQRSRLQKDKAHESAADLNLAVEHLTTAVASGAGREFEGTLEKASNRQSKLKD